VRPGRPQTLPLAMRVVSWIGGVVLVAVVSAGTVFALHAQTDSAHTLAASQHVATADVIPFLAEPRIDSHRPRPARIPSPDPTSAPAAPQRSAPAAPAIVVRTTQQQLVNSDRAAAGLGPLSWSNCLYSVAVSNANRLARQGWVQPYHTNGPSLDLGCGLGRQAGENVGYWSSGIADSRLNTMFLASPEHHANIMGPYRYVATAWVVASDGSAYIAVEFG
jgi:uncharacterized protein YkwD